MRVGIGHDTHRLEPGRPMILGGVTIECDRGPVGHSDADVLLHAVTDALFGAGGLGDIGGWFPDDDPAFAGADSSAFVTTARDELKSRGWSVANLDCTVFAETPRVGPVAAEIRGRIAELLELPPDAVNVKAKSGEGVGPIGRGEAIAAQVVVLIERSDQSH